MDRVVLLALLAIPILVIIHVALISPELHAEIATIPVAAGPGCAPPEWRMPRQPPPALKHPAEQG